MTETEEFIAGARQTLIDLNNQIKRLAELQYKIEVTVRESADFKRPIVGLVIKQEI